MLTVCISFLGLLAAACASLEDSRAAIRPTATPMQETAGSGSAAAVDVWSRLFGGGDEAGQYESLSDMVLHSPEIVRATTIDVRPGRVVGMEDGPEYAFQEVYFVLRVQEVLAGETFRPNEELSMGVGGVPFGADIPSQFSDVVGDEGLFFLIQLGAPQPEFERSRVPEELLLNAYRPVSGQGVFINDAGRVVAARRADPGFHVQLHGLPFENLVQQVEALVAAD